MSKKSDSNAKPNPGCFPKGRSGNPGGRPKASRASQGSAFDIVMEKTLTVSDQGGTRQIPLEEALQHRTYRDAVAGKRMAMREVMKMIKKREAWLAKHAAKASFQRIPRYISPDPDNADAALLLLGITASQPARTDHGANWAQQLLEPWAVQAALRRRRGGHRLTKEERAWIKSRTRDPNSVRWPRETDK